MPTYQYACTECGESLEAVQSFTDDSLTECPACSGRLRKVFSAVGVVFKGSGFYRNDSRAGNGSKTSSSSDSDSSASKDSNSASGESSTSAANASSSNGSSNDSGGSSGSSSDSSSGTKSSSTKSTANTSAA